MIFRCTSDAQVINIRESNPPTIDGQIIMNEWSAADSVLIDLGGNSKVTVKFMHDGSNFYFAFLNNLESFNIRFPEILLDPQNDKSTNWMSDDWWFHVSATDCESNTAANDYSNCLLVQPDWQALNNFASGLPYTDTVEISIPFSKLNYIPTLPDTIGIAFDVTNTFSAWNFWPAGSTSLQNPSTWGTAIVHSTSTSISSPDQPNFHLTVYPNPSSGEIKVSINSNSDGRVGLALRDMTSRLIWEEWIEVDRNLKNFNLQFDNEEPGVYFLESTYKNTRNVIKIVKQ